MRTFGGFGGFWRVWGLARCPWAIAVALWWLLRAGVLGYLFPAELCELFEGLEGFGGFEAWQTAAWNAYKKPLLRPEGALEPLLWPCGGFCVREWRVLGLLGYLFPAALCELLEGLEGFGGFEAWQTAALNTYKKPLQRPEGALSLRSYANVWRVWRVLEGLRPGKRQPWTPIRSHCSGRKVPLSHCCGLVVACACGSGACWACWGTFSLRSYANFWRVWRVLEGLRPGKVPLTHCCGLVVAFACGSGACWACWGTFSPRSYANCLRVWRVLEGLRPGKRQPGTPIRSHCSGRKVPLSHCCGLVVAFACEHGAWRACWVTLSLRSSANFWRVWSLWRVLEGFGGFEAWQTAALNA